MNFKDVNIVESFDQSSNKNTPVSTQVDGIELRLLPPYIKDNRTVKFWPFPGLAHLYYLTIVVSDIENQLSCDIDIIAFPKIGDRELLPVNKTIYYWSRSNCNGKMPEQIHLMCSVIKSKEPLREIANVINQLKRDEMYNTLTDRILSMIATTATRSIITNFVLDLAHIVGRYLGLINDKPIATVINSFTRIHGDWSNFGVTPLSINVKNVTFYFELIVRNSSFFSKSKLLPEYGIPDHQSMTRLF